MIYIIGIICFIVLFVLVTVIKTIIFSNNQKIYDRIINNENINKDNVVKKLQKAIQIKTISNSDYTKTDFSHYLEFINMLEKEYPLVHDMMDKTVINKYSLIFKWKGSNTEKKPGMVMAHIDVVPVEEGTLKDWKCDPFSGELIDGFVYGRGSMDIKIQIITLLEACENLIKENFTPERDMYFCFGHDEEVGGRQGAQNIVEYFKKKKITFEFVLDEGGAISSGAIPNIKKDVAYIGVAEKGYCNLQVKINSKGGHASTPPKNTSLGLVSKTICKIEKEKMKLHFNKASMDMIKALAHHMSFLNKLIIANLWIFKPLFIKAFVKEGTTSEALLRTTIAPTMAKASMEPNVLPQNASFTINCRILQGDSGNDLINHIKTKCKGLDYSINILRLDEPSNISSSKSEIFKTISAIINGIYDNIAIVPYLMVAGTDSYKFESVSNNVIRFTPFRILNDDMKRVHGTNERISVDNIVNCVKFYKVLMKNY